MRRVDVQPEGAAHDGRSSRYCFRTAPPAPPAATRVSRLRGQKWPSFGACSLSHFQSSTQEAGAPQNRRISAETAPWIHPSIVRRAIDRVRTANETLPNRSDNLVFGLVSSHGAVGAIYGV